MEDVRVMGPGGPNFFESPPEFDTVLDYLENINEDFVEAYTESSREKKFSKDTKITPLFRKKSLDLTDVGEELLVEDLQTKFFDILEKNPGVSPMEIARGLVEKVKDGLKNEAEELLFEILTPDEKPEISIGPENENIFQDRTLQIRKFNKKTKKVNSLALQPESYSVSVMTHQQYARISTIALNSLNVLSETLRMHQKKTESNRKKGEYSLRGRTLKQDKTNTQIIQVAMKDAEERNRVYQNKTEARENEIKEEELAIQEYRERQSKVKNLDKKNELKKQMTKRDEFLKGLQIKSDKKKGSAEETA